MCTSPIKISRFYPALRASRAYTVPCGKCEECRAKYQNEFAALAVLAAEQYHTMHFFTFTYRDSRCPIVQNMYLNGSCYDQVYSRGLTVELVSESKQLQPCFLGSPEAGQVIAPSLNRKDIQTIFKRFREDYRRVNGESLDFKYSFFGEYGDRRFRPHFHGIVCGLSDAQASELTRLWNDEFGFVDCKPIPFLNKDGSPAFIKVARYVSKYICKRDFLPDFVKNGYAELPRRQSSIGFGRSFTPDQIQQYKNFT